MKITFVTPRRTWRVVKVTPEVEARIRYFQKTGMSFEEAAKLVIHQERLRQYMLGPWLLKKLRNNGGFLRKRVDTDETSSRL